LEKWPKFDKKKVNENLVKKIGIVRETVSLGLKERDKAGIGLKWPLQKAEVYGKGLEFNKELIEIIKEQLNVKEILINEKENFGVELDTKITPGLEAEGYARELSRQVQAYRKELGLNKKDLIKLFVQTDDNFVNILKSQGDFIKERTNSESVEFVTTIEKENFKNNTDFKIKDKRGTIGIIVR
jgi:isoleucyl-tRNA synthetase